MRANGKNSKDIGKHYNITREHIRQYWFSQLNKKTLKQIEKIIKGKIEMKTENQIKKDMSKYRPEEFNLYLAEAGWEDWMNEYTDAEDGKECSEAEIREIEKIQKKLWDEVFMEDCINK